MCSWETTPWDPASGNAPGQGWAAPRFGVRIRLGVVEIPIACALEPSAARSQLGEWQDAVRHAVGSSIRVSANRLELGLLPGAHVEPIVRLAQREAACCPFLAFSLEIHAERLTLVVEVADDAVEILDQVLSGVQ